MTEKTARRVRLYYGIFLSVFTVVTGLLFIVQAALIYYADNTPPYSPEIVASRLSAIAVPVWIWVAAVIIGFVLGFIFRAPARRLTHKRTPRETLVKLCRRIPVGEEENLAEKGKRLQRAEEIRLAAWAFCFCLCLASAIVSAVYLFNHAHFAGQNLNAEILAMLRHVLPWVGAGFAACIAFVVIENIAAKRELPYVKKLVAGGGMRGALPLRANGYALAVPAWVLPAVRIALAVLGVTFILVGIFNGSALDVFVKAVNICTECIGLG